jgi:single-stranded DNA-binding protein
MFALIEGVLTADPQQRSTKTGQPFTTASLKAKGSATSAWVSLAAFNQPEAGELLSMRKGDPIAVQGSFRVGTYTGKDGTVRATIDVEVSRLVTLRKLANVNDTQPPFAEERA